MQNLKNYAIPKNWDPGSSFLKRILWRLFGLTLLSSFIPGTIWRKRLLTLFGAKIGKRGIIKPFVKVTSPWRLILEDDFWIGEEVWIDNLDFVKIEKCVCISQKSYICTGNHNFKKSSFDLITTSINIGKGTWIGAGCLIAPGSNIGEDCVISFGSVLKGEVKKNTIVSGNPAVRIKDRY